MIWDQGIAINEAQIQARSQIVSWLLGESKGILEEKEGSSMKRRKTPTGTDKLIYSWLHLVGYWFCLQIEGPQPSSLSSECHLSC